MTLHERTLNPAALYILLALSLRERHGYEIMQQVAADSGGSITLGPATLYTNLKRLLEQGLIEQLPIVPHHQRRQYYRLSDEGYITLGGEVAKLQQVVKLARQRHILEA